MAHECVVDKLNAKKRPSDALTMALHLEFPRLAAIVNLDE